MRLIPGGRNTGATKLQAIPATVNGTPVLRQMDEKTGWEPVLGCFG